jgi:hypothetical protein
VTKEILNKENNEIQALLEGYLRFRSSASKTAVMGEHLDEDSLAAFVDGDLTQRENTFFASHLVDCSFCLHKTAELSQLRNAFEEEAYEAIPQTSQPVKISEVLSDLFSRLFGSSEGAVFAHEEKKDDENSEKDDSSSPDKNDNI